MNKKLGVFLNNTENESDYLINYNNYKNLKKNFDDIIVIDFNNNYSLNLKKKLEKNKDITEHIICKSLLIFKKK